MSSTYVPANTPTYKALLVGDSGTGKSAFIKRLLLGIFDPLTCSTIGVEVRPLVFHTSCGAVCFEVWDMCGQAQFGGLRDGYYHQAHCALLFHSPACPSSAASVVGWHKDVQRMCGAIPCLVVGSFSDLEGVASVVPLPALPQVCVSASTGQHCARPFLLLARVLLRQPTLRLLPCPMDPPDPDEDMSSPDLQPDHMP